MIFLLLFQLMLVLFLLIYPYLIQSMVEQNNIKFISVLSIVYLLSMAIVELF
uniref:Uncharacterized protein n=1 Tax=Picornavirales sp. TaxID=1955153 RepID=A0A514DBC4_9VIRU|nr:MAG: hypothetical protein H2RhizoLitter491361_000002 [Picornavirales sp.]